MHRPPIGIAIDFVGSDPADKTVTVLLRVNDEQSMRVDVALGIVGPLMAALAAEAMKLNAGLPEEERRDSGTLRASAVWLSQDDAGDPMIVFELANGSILPLSMKSGDLAGLAAEMSLLASPVKGAGH